MHRMHANRVSTGGTSAALDDSSIQRIGDRIASKKKPVRTATKKVASKVEQPTEVEPQDDRIVIASLNDIPADFERIGTGFFRNAHHVWQLMPADGGYVLLRKRGEDHVLGDEPEPVTKSVAVFDRHGGELKVGSRVGFPFRGKIANGTVIVLAPGVLSVDVGGSQMDVPPDMVEMLGAPDGNPDLAGPVQGHEFEPEVEPSSKADTGAPAEEEHDEPEMHATASRKVAVGEPGMEPSSMPSSGQVPGRPMPQQPPPAQEESKWRKERQLSFPQGAVAQMSQQSKLFKDLVAAQGRLYVTPGNGTYPWYEVELREGGEQPIFTIQALNLKAEGQGQQLSFDQLKEFEGNLGGYKLIGNPKTANKKHDREVVRCIMANVAQIKTASINELMVTWREYWRDVGQRVAQKKPLTQEQKERRKQKRRERRQMLKGLPPGSQLSGKHGQMEMSEGEDESKAEAKLHLYEQLVDELKFVLEDEAMRGDEVMLADEVGQMMQEFDEGMEALERQEEPGTDLGAPMEPPPEAPPRMATRAVVSMADLTKS